MDATRANEQGRGPRSRRAIGRRIGVLGRRIGVLGRGVATIAAGGVATIAAGRVATIAAGRVAIIAAGGIAAIACGAFGCSGGAKGPPDATASASASASAAPVTSAAAVAPSARCIDDDHAETTSADGTIAKIECGADAVCLGGACAPLAMPEGLGGGKIERAGLLGLTNAGWIDAWTLLGPFDRAQVDRFAKEPGSVLEDAKNGGVRALCEPSGRVDVKPRGGGHALLAGVLVSARAQKVWLQAGVAGKLRVWISAGEKVEPAIDVSRTQGLDALPDEEVAGVELRAGANLVLVDLEGTREGAPSLWIRVRDERGQNPEDVAFALASPKTSCSGAALIDVEAARKVSEDGLDFELTALVRGLAPRAKAGVPYRVELKAKKATSLTEGELSAGDLQAESGAKIAVHAAPAAGGKQAVRVELGGEDKVERSFPVVYRKKLFPRVAALVKALGSMPASAPAGSRDSFTRDVEDIERATAEGHPDERWISKRLEVAEGLAEGFARGEDPYRSKTGVVMRAYRSELDGQLQPYVAYIPKSHKADGAPMPMIVSFHGLTHQGEHALRAVIGQATKEDENPDSSARHLPGFPDQGAILVAPWGFGRSGPRQLGEHDVLRVIEEMKAAYRVDATRVSITGYSLGGTVAFALPLHYPSIFSAAAPLCGYPNLTTYNSVKDVRHEAWEEAMIARRFLGNYAANGLHVPMHIVHGGNDGPGRSKVIADRYSALKYSRIFDVQKELGHNVWDYAYEDGRMVAWLKRKQQPAPPNHVRLVTGEYRYDTSYWVRLIAMERSPGAPGSKIEKIDQPDSFADIDAQMDWPSKALRIATRNVSAFAIDTAALGAPKGTVATVDGAEIPLDEAAKTVFFTRDEKGWSASTTEPPRAGKKRSGVSGPLDDILRHAQLIVFGTQDPAQTEANRTVAEHFSSADQWASARFPIKADRDVTEAELTGRSLVLIGGPAANRVTAMFAEGLPAQFEPKAITFRGARYEGEEVGVSFIYPHPRDPAEYVVIHAGTTFRGTLASRHLPQLAPDFLVYDRRITAMRGELLLDRRAVLAGGFFTDDWK
ncbi:MAG: prolyl oligopeptidase family serine peptidase [Polyangiaceae bacterium]